MENSKIKIRQPTHDEEPEDVDVREDDNNTPRQEDFQREKNPVLILSDSSDDEKLPYVTPVALQRRRKMRVPPPDDTEAEDSEVERVARKKMGTKKQPIATGNKVMCC